MRIWWISGSVSVKQFWNAGRVAFLFIMIVRRGTLRPVFQRVKGNCPVNKAILLIMLAQRPRWYQHLLSIVSTRFEWWLIFFTLRIKLITEFFSLRSNRVVCPKKAFIVFRAQIKKLNHLSRDFCNGKPYKIYKALISMSFVDASKTSYEGWKSHWFHIISGYNFQMPFNWLMMLKSNQNSRRLSISYHRLIVTHWRFWFYICNGLYSEVGKIWFPTFLIWNCLYAEFQKAQ